MSLYGIAAILERGQLKTPLGREQWALQLAQVAEAARANGMSLRDLTKVHIGESVSQRMTHFVFLFERKALVCKL